MAASTSWEYIPDLTSLQTICDECRGTLQISSDPPAEITIYSRHGTKFARHVHKECPNRWCRKRFFHGFSIKDGKRVYECLSGKQFLVTSSETAFSLDFCYEMTLHCVHNNATFHGLENIYNQLHNYNRQNIRRVDLNRKRLATAFFLYGFLEFTFRTGILHEFSCGDAWLDDTILEYYNLAKVQFSHHWTYTHVCDVPNCETMMVSDGGMKIMRSVCAAKFSSVRKYSHSDKAVLTGCTSSPSPNSPFCNEHKNSESPVLLAENLTLNTRTKLREWRLKEQAAFVSLPKDTVFIIQAVLSSRQVKGQKEYLVKFAGFPEEAACWEPTKNLPTFILDFYKIKANLSKPIPGPKVKRTKQVGNNEIFLELEWCSDKSSNVAFESEELFALNADILCSEAMRSTCNTRKVRDKRDRRHTAGILISSKPCGIIPHVDELFGCESIKQVHGSIIEFLGTCTSDVRQKLQLWMFDDMCHLKPHSEKKEIRKQSTVSEEFGSLSKAVDKFHFPGHKKSDAYCRENCNPNIELKNLGIKEINSPACEQAFKWINCFKNLKTMNEPRFKFFLLYMIDLHNQHIEGNISTVANPLSENWSGSRQEPSNLSKPTSSDDLISELEKMTLDSKLVSSEIKSNIVENERQKIKIDDCFSEDPSGTLKCMFCPGKYKREGNIKNHVESKHNMLVDLVCKCGQFFVESTRYSRHKKDCNKN